MRICKFAFLLSWCLALGCLVHAQEGSASAQGADFQLRSQEFLDRALLYDFKLTLSQSGVLKVVGRKNATAPDTEVWQLQAVEEEVCDAEPDAIEAEVLSKSLSPGTGFNSTSAKSADRSLRWLQFRAEKLHNGKSTSEFEARGLEDLKSLGQKPQFAILGVFMREPIRFQLNDRMNVEGVQTAGVFVSLGARLSSELKASIASRYELLLPEGPVKLGDTWSGQGKIEETAFDPRGSLPEIKVEIEAKLVEFIESGPQSRVVIEQVEKPKELPLAIKPRFGMPLNILSCEQRRRFEFDLKGYLVAESTVLNCKLSSTMKIAGREAERILDLERKVERKLRPTSEIAEQK